MSDEAEEMMLPPRSSCRRTIHIIGELLYFFWMDLDFGFGFENSEVLLTSPACYDPNPIFRAERLSFVYGTSDLVLG